MTSTLIDLFPAPDELLALPPEDLAGIIMEIMPAHLQNGMFNIDSLKATIYRSLGPSYPPMSQPTVTLALAEALTWLTVQGLLIIDPTQPALWYRPTRRGQNVRTRADVEAYRKSRILPDDLLPPLFLEKVTPLFRRGDHDIAVFQAFKEVEVAVRKAANIKGAGYPDDLVGTRLMRHAFHPETGLLADKAIVSAERQAETDLFSGAIGHAKNPTSHRDMAITAPEAARLIVFASHLMDIVHRRA